MTKESSMDSSKPIFDKTSYCRPREAITEHISLKWKLDFTSKRVHGSVLLKCRLCDVNCKQLILDTRSLDISKVKLRYDETDEGAPAHFSLSPKCEIFGSKMVIDLDGENVNRPTELPANGTGVPFFVEIHYSTASGDNCTATQWLLPEQTAGKKAPYFFTQCQAIHARSLLPCQDTPLVKCTYDALVDVPEHLTAVMSASSTQIRS
eukprot:g5907.t1